MAASIVTGWVAGYALVWLTVAGLLGAMCVSDVRTRRIPNRLVAGVCGAWALMQAASWSFDALAGFPLAEAAQMCGVPQALLPLFTLPSALAGILTAVVSVALLAGAGALHQRFFRRQSMGFGDVKLIGAFALFLGPLPTVVCLMLACLFALVTALPARLRTFPFAPALTVAFVCVMLVEL